MIRTYAYKDIKIEEIFAREEEKTNVADVVAQIIAEVRKGGDAALKRYAEQFDGAAPAVFEVSEEERAAAYAQADAAFLEILKEAAAHIRAFHEKQKRTDFVLTEREGVVLGQKIIPLDRVGLYVPGGTASYPSTVLMDCIPAKIAGVKEVCMVTPAKDGKLNPDIIAAAEIAGVDRIFRIGGAQAVAALAYGTESIPRVDKIVGPGNAFVAEAKKQVFGQVSIDMIAGPNHTLPTSGTARFSSPLGVDDFVKRSSFTYYTKEALAAEAEKIGFFARREGLEAHARSALVRKDKGVIQ